jgi:predicted RNA-binding Zn ribbon-like protein
MTTPAWTTEPEKKPAPGSLQLVQSFVNSRDFDSGLDLLVNEHTAIPWLRERGLLAADAMATAADLSVARDVRESIRALLSDTGARTPADIAGQGALRDLTSHATARITIGPDGNVGLEPVPAGSLQAGLATLLLIIRDAQRDGTWARLKVCSNPDCEWAFYDRSHARRGTWCDMASCGNLIKNRNLRARAAGKASP